MVLRRGFCEVAAGGEVSGKRMEVSPQLQAVPEKMVDMLFMDVNDYFLLS